MITESISVGSAPAGAPTHEGRRIEEANRELGISNDEVSLEENEHCDKGPIEPYDMAKYPFLAIDFFDGDKSFVET